MRLSSFNKRLMHAALWGGWGSQTAAGASAFARFASPTFGRTAMLRIALKGAPKRH
jgi:hypothetical protein